MKHTPIATGGQDQDLEDASRALFFTLFPSIMLPMFIAVGDQTIIAAALPAIATDLGGVDRVSWVVVSYLISTTVAAPVYGRLGDMFGVKPLMIFALCLFMVSSVGAALAGSVELLSIARVAQGLGGGGLITLSQALIGTSIPARERARYQGYLATVASTASALGPVTGGLLTQHFGWQSVFLVNLPLGLMAIVMTLRLPVRTGASERARFDFVGLALLSGFVTGVVIAVQQWRQVESPIEMFSLIGFDLLALTVLVWHERRTTNPLFPVALFHNPSIWRSNVVAAFHGAVLVSLITYLPLFIRVTHGGSPSRIGALLLPMTIGLATGSILTGRIVSRTGRTALFPSVGLIGVTAMLLFIALFSDRLTAIELSVLVGLTTVFMGTVMGVVQVIVQVAAGPKLVGASAASAQFSKSLGSAFGAAIVSGVIFAALAFSDTGAADVFASALQHGPDALNDLPVATRAAVREDIGTAFRYGFLVIAVFAAAAGAFSWWIPMRRI